MARYQPEPEFNYDPSQLEWSGDFNDQFQNVINNVRLTRDEVNKLSNLFADLQRYLQWIWRGCQVLPFGSIVTGLGILSSDVDVYIKVPDHYNHDQVKSVVQARNALRKYPWIFRKLFAITTAKVPILKLYHAPTGRYCDINFKSLSGVRNSRLIATLLQMDERALPLTVIIKYWSKVHKLTGTNLLSNYALTLLTIFYMQQKNILPSVSVLQKITSRKVEVEEWNTAFTENYQHQFYANSESMYELLGQFFQFYSTFDFSNYIISPFMGENIHRTVFKQLESVPHHFDYYKRKGSDEKFSPLNISTPICVQDVFEHNRNCTAAVYPRLAMSLKLHIQLAAKIYTESSSKDFLKLILLTKPDLPKPVKRNRPDFAQQLPTKTKNNKNIPSNDSNKLVVQQEPARNLKRPGGLVSLFVAGRSKAKKAKH